MGKNYIQLVFPEDVESQIRTWVKNNIPEDVIDSTPPSHMTLLYGCCDDLGLIRDTIGVSVKVSWETQTHVKVGDVSDVVLVPIKTDDELFWKVYNNKSINTSQCHTLIDGKFSPHLTLCWLKKGKKDKNLAQLLSKLSFPKLSGIGNLVLSPGGHKI